jgi:hypothetical protein
VAEKTAQFYRKRAMKTTRIYRTRRSGTIAGKRCQARLTEYQRQHQK